MVAPWDERAARLARDLHNPNHGSEQLRVLLDDLARQPPDVQAQVAAYETAQYGGRRPRPEVEGAKADQRLATVGARNRAHQMRVQGSTSLQAPSQPLSTPGGWLGALAPHLPDLPGRFQWMADPTRGPRPPMISPFLAGDVLGTIGTLRDIGVQEYTQPLAGAALFGARKLGIQPQRSLFAPELPASEPVRTRESFGRYLRESLGQDMVANLAVGTALDPTSYLGGGFSRLHQIASALPGGGALRLATAPLAAADRAYTRAAEAVTGSVKTGARGILGELAGKIKDVPVLGYPFGPAARSEAQGVVDRVINARAVARMAEEAQAHWKGRHRRVMLPTKASNEQLSSMGAAAMGWLTERVATMHPIAAAIALKTVREVYQEKNLIEMAVQKRLYDAEAALSTRLPTLTPEQVAAERQVMERMASGEWRTQFRKFLGAAEEAKTLLRDIADLPMFDPASPSYVQLAPNVFQAIRQAGDNAHLRVTSYGDTAAAIAERLGIADRWGALFPGSGQGLQAARTLETEITSRIMPVASTRARETAIKAVAADLAAAHGLNAGEGERLAADILKLVRLGPGGGRDYLASLLDRFGGTIDRPTRLEYADRAYRWARDQQVAELERLSQHIEGAIGPRPELSLGDDYLARYHHNLGSSLSVQGGDIAAAAHVPAEAAQVLRDYDRTITAAQDSILRQRTEVLQLADEVLTPWMEGLGLPPDEIASRWHQYATREEALRRALDMAGAPREVSTRIDGMLRRHRGDLLDDEYLDGLIDIEVQKAIYRQEGVKELAPWLEMVRTRLAAWSNQALLSFKYPAGNMAFGVWVSGQAGISPVKVLARIEQVVRSRVVPHLRTFGWHEVPLDARPPAHSMPGAVALGLEDRVSRTIAQPPSMLQTKAIDWLTNAGRPLTSGESLSAAGRISPVERAALFGGLGATGGLMTPGATPEERSRNAVVGGAIGAGAGLALPKAIYGLYLITGAIEQGLRDTAWYHGLLQAAPRELDQAVDDIVALARSSPAPVVGITSTVVPRQGNPAQVERLLRDWAGRFKAGDHAVDVSPAAVEDLFSHAGYRYEEANAAGRRMRLAVERAAGVGTDLANRLNIDYRRVSRAEEFLRTTGLMPFVVWQARMYPVIASLLVQHPYYLAAIETLNDLSEDDVKDGGLTGRFAQMARSGSLGTWLADNVLDRKGNMLMNPLKVVLPFADVFAAPRSRQPGREAPLDQPLEALRRVGLSLAPVATLPLEAAGLASDQGGQTFRINPYIGALTYAATAATGQPAYVDPEAPIAAATSAVRGALGGTVDASSTGDPYRDWLINTRLAEAAYQGTGHSPSPQVVEAMGNPASPIWQRARAAVDRQLAGQALLGFAGPPWPTKLLSDAEAQIRQRMAASGVATDQIERLRSELLARPDVQMLTPALREEFVRQRVQQARRAAEALDPAVRSLALTGSDPTVRLRERWAAVQLGISSLPPSMREGARARFLRAHPEFLAVAAP